ncbi:MAG: hypothetical protein K0S38_171 [Candidatus Paceibacter sp.]|jgi:predicted alpha/beta hydrolase family esterase|nr:hypothetical protein [Candidatus Paceibacter sp.]
MERTLTIRHNWNDRDESKWLFWLEKKLTELGFTVSLADLPDAAKKDTQAAVTEIETIHGIDPRNVIIIRHDPGCLTLLKYCEQLLHKNSMEPVLLIAGIPRRSYGASASVLKMIGGPRGLVKTEGDADDRQQYQQEQRDLTLDTMDIKLMVVYGGQLVKALPTR